MNLPYILLAGALVTTSSVVDGASPISDAPDGVSCRHFVSSGNMRWIRAGGDWEDATGGVFGSRAFSVTDIPVAGDGQLVHLDITALARSWTQGAKLVGGIFLAVADGGDSGISRFHSRESGDRDARPRLRVEWRNGTVSEFSASADSSLNCTTSKTLGGAKTLTVGRDRNAILLFPFNGDAAGVASATLILTVQKQFRPGTSIAVYRPIVPGSGIFPSESGLSAAYPRDRGITRHPAVVFAENFEDDDWASHLSSVSQGSDAILTRGKRDKFFEPVDGEALRVSVPQGQNVGLNALYRFARETGSEPEEMYFRYMLRFGDDWDPIESGGKLPGFAGTYDRGGWGGRKANGRNGWSTRGTFFRARDHGSTISRLRGIGSYVYSADMKGTYGSTWGWNLGPTGMLEKNRWYSIEQHVRLNTPGRPDGVLRAWVDGQLVFERTDIRFRDVPDLKIETLWMNVYHGGTTRAPQDMTLYIDNLVIASEYIGPLNIGRTSQPSLRKGL